LEKELTASRNPDALGQLQPYDVLVNHRVHAHIE
jgi:hypothetical protein